MTIIRGVVYKKFTIFKVFGVYLSEFLIFYHEIVFGSKILLSSCDKAKQNKMFVCENPGGQKKVHQAGRESIFSLIFRLYI